MAKPGDNIDSWCGTCKMMLAHTIEAMVGEKPARVHCNTCNAQHNYRANKPGETTRKSTGTRKPRASQYEQQMAGKNVAQAKPYSPKDTYAAGDVLQHPTFGIGVASVVKDPTKVEVIFEGGVKLLAQGR
jgi:hypothetical protein